MARAHTYTLGTYGTDIHILYLEQWTHTDIFRIESILYRDCGIAEDASSTGI